MNHWLVPGHVIMTFVICQLIKRFDNAAGLDTRFFTGKGLELGSMPSIIPTGWGPVIHRSRAENQKSSGRQQEMASVPSHPAPTMKGHANIPLAVYLIVCTFFCKLIDRIETSIKWRTIN